MWHFDEEWYGDGNRYIFPALAESLYIEAQADHASDCSRYDASRFLDVRALVIVGSNKDAGSGRKDPPSTYLSNRPEVDRN